jgi:hypothetical protein
MAAASLPSQPGPPPADTSASALAANPTWVPRNDGITDGEWNARDEQMVAVAQKDAGGGRKQGDKGDAWVGLTGWLWERVRGRRARGRMRGQ